MILLLVLIVGGLAACGGGGDGGSEAFATLVANYKSLYGKSDEWETWMINNQARYLPTFSASTSRPSTLIVSFRYDTTPIAYAPAWPSEAAHMSALTTMAEGAYPGYVFDFQFQGSTSGSYANVIAGIPTNLSYADGKNVYLYYETIFNHEFGHVMQLPHHYDSAATIGDGQHMPPGDTVCIMDRTSSMYCSACRVALGLPLDVNDTTAMDAAMADILGRYPY